MASPSPSAHPTASSFLFVVAKKEPDTKCQALKKARGNGYKKNRFMEAAARAVARAFFLGTCVVVIGVVDIGLTRPRNIFNQKKPTVY